ncbi:hypothetical protein OG949_41165 (plasmid) [Streptomyces scopuliridis]|uniref:hypothetical protein n=1 Tax=Streptomyces scopuliridis TaxID=452529 RepID=UPI002DDC25DB|nr:hypothetical protein [Streptomyces scopuliridis]WSB39153.1 hypothetical protein OG949_41165 [Streptomyces scopuliridis]
MTTKDIESETVQSTGRSRGRKAVLPPADYAAPQVVEPLTGLVVRHCDRDGHVRDFDFSTVPLTEPLQRSLAVLFAARTRGWGAHTTSEGVFGHVQAFGRFASQRARPPGDLDEVTAALVKAWWEQQKHTSGGREAFRSITSLLRDDSRLRSGPVFEELTRRVPALPSKVESYELAEFDRIRLEARRVFRAALLRIQENAAHLETWHNGGFAHGTLDWVLGEALDQIARAGDVPRYQCGKVKIRYQRAVGGRSAEMTWKRLFLDRMEATALGILLMAQFGWNLSVINVMPTPKAAPDPGPDGRPTYRIPVRKHKGYRSETENTTDTGADSPGRLITQALRATRFARALAHDLAPGIDRLVAWRAHCPQRPIENPSRRTAVGPIRLGLNDEDAAGWRKRTGTGSPFRRGRRTVVVDRGEPSQHTRDTHERRYVLPDRRVQRQAAPVVAAGAAAAVEQARKTVSLAAKLSNDRAPGHQETATADCSGTGQSPVPVPGGGCGASFLTCLACESARIHADHHPRLVHLHQALTNARSILPASVWDRDWSDAHARLDDLRGKVGAGVWDRARGRITAADREIVDDLLSGDLNP